MPKHICSRAESAVYSKRKRKKRLHVLISLDNPQLEHSKDRGLELPVTFEPRPPKAWINSTWIVQDIWCIIPFIHSLIRVLKANMFAVASNILITQTASKLEPTSDVFFFFFFSYNVIHNPAHLGSKDASRFVRFSHASHLVTLALL